MANDAAQPELVAREPGQVDRTEGVAKPMRDRIIDARGLAQALDDVGAALSCQRVAGVRQEQVLAGAVWRTGDQPLADTKVQPQGAEQWSAVGLLRDADGDGAFAVTLPEHPDRPGISAD